MAIDIGLRLSHSQGTMEFLKRNAIELYLTLLKINGKDKVEFSDVMILESSGVGGNHYSCPLCETKKLYSTAFGHAQKHFRSHLLDTEEVLKVGRERHCVARYKYQWKIEEVMKAARGGAKQS